MRIFILRFRETHNEYYILEEDYKDIGKLLLLPEDSFTVVSTDLTEDEIAEVEDKENVNMSFEEIFKEEGINIEE